MAVSYAERGAKEVPAWSNLSSRVHVPLPSSGPEDPWAEKPAAAAKGSWSL